MLKQADDRQVLRLFHLRMKFAFQETCICSRQFQTIWPQQGELQQDELRRKPSKRYPMKNNLKPVTINKTTNKIPPIDLETVHQTLSYILNDVAGDHELKHVAEAISEALNQIEIAQVRQKYPDLRILRHARLASRFTDR